MTLAFLQAASDEELMAELRSKADDAAFEELARRYTDRAYRAALAMLGAPAAAEDAVQECFLRLVRARRSYRPDSRFSPWFYAMLRNACRDEIRRRGRASAARGAGPRPDEGQPPHAELELREAGAAAGRALAQLPEAEREVLILRVLGGLRFAEIAAVCGISPEAAKKRAYRGLERMRRELAGKAL